MSSNNNKISFEYAKQKFNGLYNDLIRDERRYVEENIEDATQITEEEFIDKYEEEVDNIPLNKLLPSHYKNMRILDQFFNQIKREEEEEEESEEEESENDDYCECCWCGTELTNTEGFMSGDEMVCEECFKKEEEKEEKYKDYSQYNVKELKIFCKERGMKKYSKLRKKELIKLLMKE